MDPLSLNDLAAHHRRVRGLVASLVGDPDLGEDAVQGAWLKLLEAKGRPWPRELGAWLHVAARRLASNERRGTQRRRDRERLMPHPGSVPSSAEIAERSEVSARVLAALDSLGEPHQSVLRDHYLGGLTVPQMASRDDLPFETVRSRLRRGRAAFRERLEADGLGGDVHWSVAAAPLVFDVSPFPALGAGAVGTATGWILMKKLSVALTLVAMALLGLRMLAHPSSSDPRSPEQHLEGGAELDPVASTAENALVQDLAAAPPEAGRLAADTTASASVDAAYHLVKGQVVDGNGRPLERASVRAASVSDWLGATGGIVVSARGVAKNGFETATVTGGRFALNLPLPIPPWVTVTVTAGRHRAQYSEVLANRGESVTVQPTQAEDLGILQLGQACAILGRVTSRDSEPIGGARLSIYSTEFGSIGLDAVSGEDGRYVLGHNPAGTFQVSVRAHGYFEGVVEGVTMRTGRDTLGVDFVLDSAPLISGKVVDQDGAPIAGQRVWAWPKSAFGRSTPTGADSDANGNFVVSPVRPVYHDLEAGRRGYEATGSGRRGRVRALPGDENVEIVLRRMPDYRLCVLDDATGAPIERFGASVLRNNGAQAKRRSHTERRPPKIVDHPGGSTKLAVRVGIDALFVVAQGYGSYDRTFGLDDGAGDTRTIRLAKSPVVKGRVLRDGVPVAGARIVLEKPGAQRRSGLRNPSTPTVFIAHRNKRSETISGTDGCFEVPMIGYGNVRISACVGDREVGVRQVRIDGNDHDIGNLDLGPYGVIEGQITVPAGLSSEGLQISLDEWSSEKNVLTSASGRFRMERVLPGLHQLVLRGVDPHLESLTGQAFEVVGGQTSQAVLDASGHGRGELVLTILLDGEPAIGTKIDVEPLRATPFIGSRIMGSFGECDGLGRVQGHCRTYPGVAVAIYLGFGELYHPEVILQPRLGEVQEHTISFETADVTLRLPEDLVWPKNARLELGCFRTDRTMLLYHRSLVIQGGAMARPKASRMTIEPGALTVRRVLAGAQILHLAVQDLDQPGTSNVVGSKILARPGPNDFVLEAVMTLRPGPGNEVELRLAK